MPGERDFFDNLNALLDQSHDAYRAYLDGGKIFARAQDLRIVNDSIRALLHEGMPLLPQAQKNNAGALLHHLDVWSALWDEHRERLNPGPDTLFAFENTVNFPRSEVRDLLNNDNQKKHGT